jgi:hypothetical protein
MVSIKEGRLFRRKDGKYLIYLPKDLCEDSAFPFKLSEENPALKMKITFDSINKNILAEAV